MPMPHTSKRLKLAELLASPKAVGARQAPSMRQNLAAVNAIEAASKWISEADAVLVVAGAGLSATPGQNVYVDEADFERCYPAMARRWGVRTAYECMGMQSLGVPKEVVAGFYVKHCHNMFVRFAPNGGYAALKRLVGDKEHFVLTSNVDGLFAKAGFDPSKVYTPQGEMAYHQCQRSPPCTRETWECDYESLIPQICAETMALRPRGMAEMRCPGGCGGRTGPNLRGSASFVHQRYQSAQDRLVDWLEDLKARGKRVVVLEVGAGFNSPLVTRFPAESIARDLQGALVRINPNPVHSEVPRDLEKAVAIPRGWDALLDVEDAEGVGFDAEGAVLAAREAARERHHQPEFHDIYKTQYGHFDWREMLYELSDAAREPLV